jgi:valine--tRNA ligase
LESEEIKLYPKRFDNTYRHWLENVRDWNISRQLWWGQQIPAYYYGTGKEDFVVAETKEQALALAKEKTHNPALTLDDLRQDEDALDTWFSSWLWPMSVFNGILDPDNEDFKYYYPTQDLVTGPDILFFWVARMIIAGYEFAGEKPFTNVYLTGLVRDKLRRKMSKSLGNSPDALQLIKDFGADGVRVGLLLSSSAGNDLLFDEALCQQGSGFANKLWNAFRLIKGWQTADIAQPDHSQRAITWFRARFQKVLSETEDDFSKYRISDALMKIYKLVWDDFCSWLLEIIKPAYGAPIDNQTLTEVIALFEDNLKLLHPFMPFVTEEIWQQIAPRTPQEALIIASYPEQKVFDEGILAEFEFVQEVISGIRTIRKEKNIAFKDEISLSVINNEQVPTHWDSIIQKLGNIPAISYTDTAIEGAVSFRVKANEYFIPILDKINVAEEIKKLEKELAHVQGFLKSVRAKLSNERFVSSAPTQVIETERKKEADALAKIETLEKSLQNLK